MAAVVGSVYCHLAAPAPSKELSCLKGRLWLRLRQYRNTHIHTHTHIHTSKHIYANRCTANTCEEKHAPEHFQTHANKRSDPNRCALGCSRNLHQSQQVFASYHGEKNLKHSRKLIFTQGLKLTPQICQMQIKMNCDGSHQSSGISWVEPVVSWPLTPGNPPINLQMDYGWSLDPSWE